MKIKKLHHIAIICSDYQQSLRFYTEVLGFEILQEHYRKQRKSYKAELALNGEYLIELFSFPNPPERPSYPEACGLRHIAFEVDDLDTALAWLDEIGIYHEAIRIDEYTGKRFSFFADPDNLPIELYEKRHI